MAPPMTPRPRPSYNMGEHGGSRNGPAGNYLLKPASDAQIKKLSWDGKQTIIRAFPCPSYEDPENAFEPYRMDPGGKNCFSDWIRAYDVAWGVGNPGITFLLGDPTQGNFDPWMSPLGVLYRAIEKACKGGQGRPEWYPLREGRTGQGKALTGPKQVYLIQGAIMMIDDKLTFGQGRAPLGWGPNPPTVIALSGGIGKRLAEVLSEENEGTQRGDPGDFEARYKHGDPVAPDKGRYLHFFQKGHDPRDRYQAQAQATQGASPFNQQFAAGGVQGGRAAADDGELRGFDMFVTKDMNMAMQAVLPAAQLRDKWRWWDEILYFPTPTEQANMLARCFPLSAIMYAFGQDHPEWISEEARQRWAAGQPTLQSNPANPPTGPMSPWLAGQGGAVQNASNPFGGPVAGQPMQQPFGTPGAPVHGGTVAPPDSPFNNMGPVSDQSVPQIEIPSPTETVPAQQPVQTPPAQAQAPAPVQPPAQEQAATAGFSFTPPPAAPASGVTPPATGGSALAKLAQARLAAQQAQQTKS